VCDENILVLGGSMNQVMRCQAEKINNYLANDQPLEAREFMSDMSIPFDQQDRVLSAIDRLSKPSARKVGIILELSGDNPATELLLR